MATDGGRALWYDEPATDWEQGLPVGNGRLGGTVFGDPTDVRIALNEDSLWAGRDVDRVNPEASEYLEEARELLLDGEHGAATETIKSHLLGDPRRIRPYQALGELRLDLDGAATGEFHRELDLRDGVARTTYETETGRVTREVFASAPDDVLAVRIEAADPGALSLTVSVDREQDARSAPRSDRRLVLRGSVVDLPRERGRGRDDADDGGWGTRFEAGVEVRAEGADPAAEDGAIRVEDADAVTVRVAAATDFREDDPTAACDETLAAAPDSHAALRETHVADHRRLFDRVELDLGDAVDAPTDERVAAFDADDDPALAGLLFQYGRYLLMASSRPGSLPANLQGLWCDEMAPAWYSDYHLNINLQMNYWPAEVGNLPECTDPLTEYVEGFRESGGEVATEHYDCDGWVAHHTSDRYNVATPTWEWGVWPTAGAWLCRHLYEHYEYTRDEAYLAERAYPTMKGAAEFLLDFLVEDDGELVTAPSVSPENWLRAPDGTDTMYCVAPTMDVELCHDLFTNCIAAAETLGVDEDFRATLRDARERLPDLQVGEHGQLQEWREDYEEAYPGHRHVSHAYALHPGEQLTLRDTPALADALRTTLDRRIEHGGDSTGWSCAWMASLFARFEAGERSLGHLDTLVSEYTRDNLFSAAHGETQIDATFGGAAAVGEMLLGSHGGELRPLQGLPGAWAEGSVSGLRARGGFEVDLTWSDGALDGATVRSETGERCRVRTAEAAVETVECDGGEDPSLDRPEDGVVAFPTEAGHAYRLRTE